MKLNWRVDVWHQSLTVGVFTVKLVFISLLG